jgi:hypothetical protein
MSTFTVIEASHEPVYGLIELSARARSALP